MQKFDNFQIFPKKKYFRVIKNINITFSLPIKIFKDAHREARRVPPTPSRASGESLQQVVTMVIGNILQNARPTQDNHEGSLDSSQEAGPRGPP